MTSRIELQRATIDQRRSQVIAYISKGKSLSEIAEILQVDVSTVSRDYQYLKENARKVTEQYMTETAPLELAKCLTRLNAVSDEAWKMVEQTGDYKEKIAALSLAMKVAVQLANVLSSTNSLSFAEPEEEPDRKQIGGKSVEERKAKPDPAETVF